jgi:hypothetical protein
VGARSTGLGGAFVALSEDLTALFWNPAGLSNLTRAQLGLDFRSLPRTLFSDGTQSASREILTTDPQFAFFGFAYPLARELGSDQLNRRGTLAFSRTLAGYEQFAVGNPRTAVPSIARYWFNSAGFGKQVSPAWQVGAAMHYVELRTLAPDDPLLSTGSIKGSGGGVTFSLGAKYRRDKRSPTTLGFNYQHPTRVSDLGLSGAVFGERINGRVSAGMAYDFGRKGRGNLIGALEGRYYFGGDDSPRVFEQRRSTADIHLGGEYAVTRGEQVIYIRGGFYTRNASDRSLFFDDRVFTAGVGIEKINESQFDLGLEFSAITGEPTFTTSVRYVLPGSTGTRYIPPGTVSNRPKSDRQRIEELEREVEDLKRRLNAVLRDRAPGDAPAPTSPAAPATGSGEVPRGTPRFDGPGATPPPKP